MNLKIKAAVAAATLGSVVAPAIASAEEAARRSIPSVVVTVENSAPSRGALLTPVWVAAHDGSFDLYDRDVPLGGGSLISAQSVERLAEDGNTGPISDEFALSLPLAPQATLVGTSGPLTPGGRSATTFNVNPESDRFFSYGSMIIPSNDAFIANGNPQAHPLFDESGNFIGEDFVVAGSEVLDAGTEVNDEVAANTAFLNQGGPDIGVAENGNVVIHEGFRTDLAFPDGVLNHPIFGLADFQAPTYRAASFKFQYVDLGGRVRFASELSPDNEVAGPAVESNGSGTALAVSRFVNDMPIRVVTSGLTGPIVMAHLHFGPEGVNGPVVVNLGDFIAGRRVRGDIASTDIVGPFAETDDPMLTLLNEMAAGNVYVNIHTAANPAGEVRGQLHLQ